MKANKETNLAISKIFVSSDNGFEVLILLEVPSLLIGKALSASNNRWVVVSSLAPLGYTIDQLR